jgi:hypothetical protein
MKKIVILLFIFIGVNSTFAQIGRRGANSVRRPMTSQEPTDDQKERFLEEMKEKQQKFIHNFVQKLEADEFQREITKTTLTDYFEKLISLTKLPFRSTVEKNDAIKNLNKDHFAELKTLISESDMQKITDLIEGNKTEDEDDKKKKKRRRKKDKG